MSGLCAEAVLASQGGAGLFDVADVDTALELEWLKHYGPAASIPIAQVGEYRPDYVWWRENPTPTDFMPVESKGLLTNTLTRAPAPALDRLARGILQVQSLDIAGQVLKGAVFCTCVSTRAGDWGNGQFRAGELMVHALDPRDEQRFDPPKDAVAHRPDGRVAVRDRDSFAESLQKASRIGVLEWCGEAESARRIRRPDAVAGELPRSDRPRRSRRMSAGLSFTGLEISIRVSDEPSLQIFTGAQEDVLARVREDDGLAYRAARDQIGQTLPSIADRSYVTGDNEAGWARSVRRDGTMLEVQVGKS